MNSRQCIKILLIAVLVSMVYFGSSDSLVQDTKDIYAPTLRAAEGDTVWILLNYIKADKRDQFNKFMEFFCNFIVELSEDGKISEREYKNFQAIRLLDSTRQNEDGTYTYIFMADPWIGGVNPGFVYYLRKKLSEEETKKYVQIWRECLDRPQVSFKSIQMKW